MVVVSVGTAIDTGISGHANTEAYTNLQRQSAVNLQDRCAIQCYVQVDGSRAVAESGLAADARLYLLQAFQEGVGGQLGR